MSVYLFQVLGTRVLGEEAFAPIGVLWTIQYLVYSVPLVSVEAYVTRTVTLHADEPAALHRSRRIIGAWLAVTAAALGAATWAARGPLFGGLGDLALVAAAVVVAYGTFVFVRGRLAGADRYTAYAAATAAESVIRLVLAAGVLAVAASTRSLAWVLPVGPFVVVAWWLAAGRRHGHRAARPAPPEPPVAGPVPASTTRFLAATTTGNAAAQTLLAAGPLVLIPLGASPAEISVFFVTVTAARAPLVFVLGGMLSRLLPPLTRMARRGDAAGLRRVVAALGAGTAAAAVLGAALAAGVGPWLVGFFFGPAFAPDRLFVTMVGGAVLLATGNLLLNQLLIAARSERLLPLPWVAGVAAAAMTLLAVDASATLRVAAGFVVGEVVAFIGLLAATATLTRRR